MAAPPTDPMRVVAPPLTLRLYIAAGAPNSAEAQANLRTLLAAAEVTEYSLEVIDCLSDPARALSDGVLVTPTLVKLTPEPSAVVVGTLRDRSRLAAALDLLQEAGDV